MKRITLITTFILLIINASLQASECYHYHTIKDSKLVRLAGKNYLQVTVKDPDNITYVSQQRYLIKNLSAVLTLVSEDEKNLIVKDNLFYYLVAKELPHQQPLTAKKLFAMSTGIKVKNSRLIRVAGKWRYIISNNYVKLGYDNVLLSKLPADFEILYSTDRGSDANYLIKSSKQVAAVNISIEYKNNTYTYNPIGILNPLTTVFTAAADDVDDNFLRDDRHFLLINYDLNFTDVTNQFIEEKKIGFNKMRIKLNSFHDPIFSDGSNNLWIYFKNGISLTDGGNPNFYPIKGKFLNTDNSIIISNGKYYNDGWAAVYEVDALDLSLVKDKASLVLLAYSRFADKYQCYKVENHRLLPDGPLPVDSNMQQLPVIASYRSYMPALRVSKNFIFREGLADSISHTSPVKSLVKAYAFDDKILIENELINNPGNLEKMVFIGAIANVIVPCDGGRGQHSVVVEYDYFFKDDVAIYAYHSGQKSFRVLEIFKPSEIRVDNFEDLQKLGNLVAKKK